MIDAYAGVHEDFSIAGKRPCITHCNFKSRKFIDQMQQLEIVADMIVPGTDLLNCPLEDVKDIEVDQT